MQDATRKQISVGDIVDIAAGKAKGKAGTVKFVHRQGLFLHVRYAFLPQAVDNPPTLHLGCVVRP